MKKKARAIARGGKESREDVKRTRRVKAKMIPVSGALGTVAPKLEKEDFCPKEGIARNG